MKNNLIKLLPFISILLIILISCSDSDIYKENIDAIKSNNYNNIHKTNNNTKDDSIFKGDLTVSTYYDGYIKKHAKYFMEIHPDVKIKFDETNNNIDNLETLEMYGKRIAVELMSGTASDLVDLAWFNINRIAKNELLCDLYKFMNNDNTFKKSDYYNNIFEALEYKGSLYAIPFTFYYSTVYINRLIAEKLGIDPVKLTSINYLDMLDIYNNAITNHFAPRTFKVMPGIVKETFFGIESSKFYSVERNKSWFNDNEFINYLNTTNSINTTYDPSDSNQWDMTTIVDGNDDFMKSEYMFSMFDINASELYNLLIDYKYSSGPIPLISSDGNAMFTTSFATYGISQNSDNKKLAWEFLKYCISEKEVPKSYDYETAYDYFMMYQGWVPINKKNFYNYFKYNFEINKERLTNKNIKWKQGEEEQLLNETLDKINEWNIQRNKIENDFELWTLVKNDLENYYYYDLATDKETADIIQNKVLSYLNE